MAKAKIKKAVRAVLSIQEKSSLLAYYTLFALVPLIAYLLALTHLLFKNEDLALLFFERFKTQHQVFAGLLSLAQSAYTAASEGLFAALAFALYLFSVLTIFYNLEKTLDQILRIEGPRPLSRLIIIYPAMLLILPLLILIASGIDLYLATTLHEALPEFLRQEATFFISRLIPYILISLLFFLCYTFIPSSKPKTAPTLLASFLAALVYLVFQWGFAYFQIWSLQRNPIYGTFAIFPLFLIWIELSWLNLLAGAKFISYLCRTIN